MSAAPAEHDASGMVKAPAGAAWTTAVVHTRRYRVVDEFQTKSWDVDVELVITHTDGHETKRMLAHAQERSDGADKIRALSNQRYELRVAGIDLEVRAAEGAWEQILVPRTAREPITGAELRRMLPTLPDEPGTWTEIAVQDRRTRHIIDDDGAPTPWIAQYNLVRTEKGGQLLHEYTAFAVIVFACDRKPEPAICTSLATKLDAYPSRFDGSSLFVRVGRLLVCIDPGDKPRTQTQLEAFARKLDLAALAAR
jgi:hypothetical protein